MVVDVYMNGRHYFRCPDHKSARMTMPQGLDTLERLRAQSSQAVAARAEEAREDIDPDLDILGDLLAESVALNNRN